METEKVIFIRGTGRCGSKNLVTMLGGHPELAHVPVNQILPEELIDWSRLRLQASDSRISDQAVAAACRAYFSAYGRALADKRGILLQKSTRNAHHLRTLLEYWPEAKIIYLVRHPLGVVEALINADIHNYRGQYGYQAGVADSLLQWYNEVSEYLRSDAHGHPRVLQVQFESLVRDPSRIAGEICRFAGLEQALLPPYGSPERFDSPFVLNETERRWIIESTREVVGKLGYDAGSWTPAVPAGGEALLDCYPDRRLRAQPPALDGVVLARMALARAGRLGHGRVGLFGAGYFARLVCPHLTDLPVEVPCIFDENPMLANSRIGAFPIRSPEASSSVGIEAVVPITFVHQAKLIERCHRLFGPDVLVVPLWNEQA
ncbi:MAG: sulfotransferase [Phycisphaerae bacterium]|nr:sulfotransferase [Phycisphaerae bacterium]